MVLRKRGYPERGEGCSLRKGGGGVSNPGWNYVPTYQCRTDTFKHSFFPWTVVEWNKIHPDIRNASITVFKKHLLKEIRPDPHPVYNICKPIGLKLLTWLRLGLSHLNEHRFNHNFENSVNPLCNCSLEVETTSQFFLHHSTILSYCLALWKWYELTKSFWREVFEYNFIGI